MGEAKRRKLLDKNYGKVPHAIKKLLKEMKNIFVSKYEEIGRFAAVVDQEHLSTIPFITLSSLESGKDWNEATKTIYTLLGEQLKQIIQTYNPEAEGIVVKIWSASEECSEAGYFVQIRKLNFDGSTVCPRVEHKNVFDVIELVQELSLSFSIPITTEFFTESISVRI